MISQPQNLPNSSSSTKVTFSRKISKPSATGLTSTSTQSLLKDILIVERNEAQQQRKQLKTLHQSVFEILKRVQKFNQKMYRRAVKRKMHDAANLEKSYATSQNDTLESPRSYKVSAAQKNNKNNETVVMDNSVQLLSKQMQRRTAKAIKSIERDTDLKKTYLK